MASEVWSGNINRLQKILEALISAWENFCIDRDSLHGPFDDFCPIRMDQGHLAFYQFEIIMIFSKIKSTCCPGILFCFFATKKVK